MPNGILFNRNEDFRRFTEKMYRCNAFRVLGVSVDAPLCDIDQYIHTLKHRLEVNDIEPLKTPLPLEFTPDINAINEAHERLLRPLNYLIDKFFWFWPIPLNSNITNKAINITDEAIESLIKNDIGKAIKYWKQKEKSDDGVPIHNLAVLYHCLALDLEHKSLWGGLNRNEEMDLENYWENAYEYWKKLYQCESFWNQFTEKIKNANDPTLDPNRSNEIRQSLPLILLYINATLAVKHAQARLLEAVERQKRCLGLFGNSEEIKELRLRALTMACKDIFDDIEHICKEEQDKTTEKPEIGDEASKKLIEKTRPLLALLDAVLPEDLSILKFPHDDVARAVLHCLTSYIKETKNCEVALKILDEAFHIAANDELKEEIKEIIETVNVNLKCWFCSQNLAEERLAVEVDMYGNVTFDEFHGTTWQQLTLKIPRCNQCEMAHTSKNHKTGLGAAIGFFIGACIVLLLAASGSNRNLLYFFVPIVFVVIGGAIGKNFVCLPNHVKPLSYARKFPKVKELLNKGWKIGKGPLNS